MQRFSKRPVWQQLLVVLAAVSVVGGVVAVGALSGDDDLIPAHKEMVDRLAASNDCSALQDRFDDAYENRGTPGSEKAKRNLALMEYADDAMDRIGCYD